MGTPGPSGSPSVGQAQQRGFGVVVVVGRGVVVAPSAVGRPAEGEGGSRGVHMTWQEGVIFNNGVYCGKEFREG